jgi:hypothetical protein
LGNGVDYRKFVHPVLFPNTHLHHPLEKPKKMEGISFVLLGKIASCLTVDGVFGLRFQDSVHSYNTTFWIIPVEVLQNLFKPTPHETDQFRWIPCSIIDDLHNIEDYAVRTIESGSQEMNSDFSFGISTHRTSWVRILQPNIFLRI